MTLYDAKHHADKGEKGHDNDARKEVKDDTSFVQLGVRILLILSDKHQAKQKKAGKDPEFHAADIGLKDKTEFWQ